MITESEYSLTFITKEDDGALLTSWVGKWCFCDAGAGKVHVYTYNNIFLD